MSVFRRGIFPVVILILIGFMAAAAQAQTEPLRVAVREVPPFVMNTGGGLRGFSIDLWEEIAARLGRDTAFEERGTVAELLESVTQGEVDLAIAAISITEEREEVLDFSVPMFRSGLQILAPASPRLSVFDTIASLLNPEILQFVLFAALFVLAAGLGLWLVERLMARRAMREQASLGDTLYDTATSFLMEDYVGERGKSAAGRMVTLVWLLIAVMFGIMLEGIVTAHLTVEQLSSQVQGLSDLYGKRVYTVGGSTSYEYLLNAGLTPITVDHIETAFNLLLQGEADAIVYDSPVLQYLSATRGQDRMHVVGDPFRLEYYGIALPQDSPLTEDINRALLAIMEDGTYERLLNQWFSG